MIKDQVFVFFIIVILFIEKILTNWQQELFYLFLFILSLPQSQLTNFSCSYSSASWPENKISFFEMFVRIICQYSYDFDQNYVYTKNFSFINNKGIFVDSHIKTDGRLKLDFLGCLWSEELKLAFKKVICLKAVLFLSQNVI